MPEDLADRIAENAIAPKRASSDAGSVEQHSIGDQILADQYVKRNGAARKPTRGLLFTKLIPPGAV